METIISKMNWVFLLMFHLFSICVGAQSDHILVSFQEASPVWRHIMRDTTLSGSEMDNTVLPSEAMLLDGDYYFLARTTAENGDRFGYILDRLSAVDKSLIWRSIHSTGSTREQLAIGNIEKIGDDFLLSGFARPVPYPENPGLGDFWYYQGRSVLFSRKINADQGSILYDYYGLDTFSSAGYNYSLPRDGLVLNKIGFLSDENEYKVAYESLQYNDDLIFVNSMGFEQLEVETDRELGPFSLEFGAPIFDLGSDRYAGLFYLDRDEPEDYYVGIQLFEFADGQLVDEGLIDLTEVIPYSTYDFTLSSHEVVDGSIFLNHVYRDSMNTDLSYFVWVDDQGEVVSSVPRAHYEDHNYLFVKAFYTDAEKCYAAALPSKKEGQGVDLVQINAGSDAIEYLSSLTSTDPQIIFTRSMAYVGILNDEFVFGSRVFVDDGSERRQTHFFGFDPVDLGLSIPTGVKELYSYEMKLYPNPCSDVLYLEVDERMDLHKIEVFNTFGQRVFTQSVASNSKDHQLNISYWNSGMYHIKLIGVNGEISINRFYKY